MFCKLFNKTQNKKLFLVQDGINSFFSTYYNVYYDHFDYSVIKYYTVSQTIFTLLFD